MKYPSASDTCLGIHYASGTVLIMYYSNSVNNVRTRCVDMITLTLQKMKGFQGAVRLALSLAFLLSEPVTIGSIWETNNRKNIIKFQKIWQNVKSREEPGYLVWQGWETGWRDTLTGEGSGLAHGGRSCWVWTWDQLRALGWMIGNPGRENWLWNRKPSKCLS